MGRQLSCAFLERWFLRRKVNVRKVLTSDTEEPKPRDIDAHDISPCFMCTY